MFKNHFVLMLFTILLVSCSGDNTLEVEEFSDQLIEDISVETRSGPSGCYEIVFPITIEFADGTTFTANNMEEAKSAARQWKENNPDIEGRPQLVFPIELVNEEGELITVDSRLDLRKIIRECRKENFNNPKGRRCFKMVFPVSILFPDGTITEYSDKLSLKMGLREWRKNNPDAEERPGLNFPVDVEMIEDGSIVTVNSKEELRQLKLDCK